MDSDDEVIVDICDVCFWQYDVIVHEQPDRNIGANHISLTQAKENYRQLGVCKIEFIHMVRGPIGIYITRELALKEIDDLPRDTNYQLLRMPVNFIGQLKNTEILAKQRSISVSTHLKFTGFIEKPDQYGRHLFTACPLFG